MSSAKSAKIIIFTTLFIVLSLALLFFYISSRVGCLFLPSQCAQKEYSLSHEPVKLILRTGTFSGLRYKDYIPEEKVREIEFLIARSFIQDPRYLTSEPQSSFELVASLPDLLPHYSLKKQMQASGESHTKIHQLWLPITLTIPGKIELEYCYSGFCGKTPTEKGYNFSVKRYGRACKTETKGFTCMHLNVDSAPYAYPECRDQDCELLVPTKQPTFPTTYIFCGKISEIIEMCKIREQYDKNIILSYKMQKHHLVNYYAIDSKIRGFIKNHIVRDEIKTSELTLVKIMFLIRKQIDQLLSNI